MKNTIRPSVFVGSSKEGLDFARAIHIQLRDDAEVTVWRDGVFGLNVGTLEALLKALDRFDFAILVLTPDDLRALRDEVHRSPRDNVLFELGLFLGRLGRSRTFFVRHPDAEMPSDFAGVTTADIERRTDGNVVAAVAPACTAIAQHMRMSPPPDVRQDVKLFRNVEEFGLLEKISDLVNRSSEITFVGTGLNVLHQTGIRNLIVKRAREGLKATICFGNPFSPYVRNRLVEEERGETKPEVATEGIINRVQAMLQVTRDVPNVEIKLFNNYPTMSILRFDDAQFVCYPMGYRKLGNRCPAMFVQKPGVYSEFLDEMIQDYLEDAVDAREVFRVKVDKRHTMEFVVPEKIRAVAVYAIPDQRTDFYRNGSELLGYDVIGEHEVGTGADVGHFHEFVGPASAYGFHLTVADVMYLEVNQIATVISELSEIASHIDHFHLEVVDLLESEFGEHSIALGCIETSGRLEKLIAEVAVRIRPLALGTNYTLDPSIASLYGPLRPRDRTMLEAYQSPYVFSRFHPHFTLAMPSTAPPLKDRQRMLKTVRRRFGSYLSGERKVQVDRLYVLEKPVDARFWNPINNDNIISLR